MEPRLRLLLAVTFLDSFGVGVVLPHIRSLCRAGGAGWGGAAAIDSLYALVQLGLGPLFAAATESPSSGLGRRGALQLATAGAGVAYLSLGLWPGLVGVLLCRVIAGCLKHGAPIIAAEATDLGPGSTANRDGLRALGRLGVAKSVGSVLGPAIGGYLSPAGAGIASGALFGLAFVLVTTLMEQRGCGARPGATPGASAGGSTVRGPWRDLLGAPDMLEMLRLWGLMAFGLSVFRGSLRPFVEDGAGVTDLVQLGWFQAALHLVEVVAGLAVSAYASTLGGRETEALQVATAIAACSILSSGLSSGPQVMLLSLMPFYGALAVARICFKTLLSSKSRQAGGSGVASLHATTDSVMTASRLVGPTAAGVLVDTTGMLTAPHYVAAALFAAAWRAASHLHVRVPSRGGDVGGSHGRLKAE